MNGMSLTTRRSIIKALGVAIETNEALIEGYTLSAGYWLLQYEEKAVKAYRADIAAWKRARRDMQLRLAELELSRKVLRGRPTT